MRAPDDDRIRARPDRLRARRALAEALGVAGTRGAFSNLCMWSREPDVPLTPEGIAEAWRRWLADRPAGRRGQLDLYLHVPFCAHRCRYCVYYSVEPARPDVVARYLERLAAEIDLLRPVFAGTRFDTAYVGGGTPTLLDERALEDLLDRVANAFPFQPDAQASFECNPASLTPAKARLFRDHGFNRASFGVQTFDPAVLSAMNRGYQTRAKVEATMKALRDLGFKINVDLIHGFAGTTAEATLAAVDDLVRLGAREVTVYALSPSTPKDAGLDPADSTRSLARLIAQTREVAARFGGTVAMFDGLLKVDVPADPPAAASGSRPFYSDGTDNEFSLLGLGPSARSRLDGFLEYRYDRYRPDEAFDAHAVTARGRNVPPDEGRRRAVVRGLDHPDGLDLDAYAARFGEEVDATFPDEVAALVGPGAARRVGRRLVLASDDRAERFAAAAMFVADEFVAEQHRRADAARDAGFRKGFVVRALGRELRFVVCPDAPDRPAAHRVGGFALQVVDGDGPPASASPLAAPLVRWLDRVVEETRPASMDDLAAALLARASSLRLRVRSGAGERVESAVIEAWEPGDHAA